LPPIFVDLILQLSISPSKLPDGCPFCPSFNLAMISFILAILIFTPVIKGLSLSVRP